MEQEEKITIDVQHEPTFDRNTNPAFKKGGVLTGIKHVVVLPSSCSEFPNNHINHIIDVNKMIKKGGEE